MVTLYKYVRIMRDNRKEIIRDLLGDFADEGEEQEQYPVSDDEDETVKRKVKKVISDSDEDDAFQLDKIIEKPSRKKNKKLRKFQM